MPVGTKSNYWGLLKLTQIKMNLNQDQVDRLRNRMFFNLPGAVLPDLIHSFHSECFYPSAVTLSINNISSSYRKNDSIGRSRLLIKPLGLHLCWVKRENPITLKIQSLKFNTSETKGSPDPRNQKDPIPKNHEHEQERKIIVHPYPIRDYVQHPKT